MKHLIIVNPKSGTQKSFKAFKKEIEKAFEGLDFEIYETKAPKDATSYLKDYLSQSNKEEVRVYACGGDGTINEVVNGLIGFSNVELAIYPVGTGNDFVKIYGGVSRFDSFEKLIKAKSTLIDIWEINGETL